MSVPDLRDYHIAWICASYEELMIARAMLDQIYADTLPTSQTDTNPYVIGRIHKHDIVISCLADELDGASSAATLAANLLYKFPAVRFGLLVGVGCGLPNLTLRRDVRLGDVVVSKPTGHVGGVVQFDKTEVRSGYTFRRLGCLDRPPKALLSALTNCRSKVSLEGSQMLSYLDAAIERYPNLRELIKSPEELVDVLKCHHLPESLKACPNCSNRAVMRAPRKSTAPQVHYGVIASGAAKISSHTFRDIIRDEFDTICIENEAAGLMNDFKCLVIRGICDYADGSDNNNWTSYAAAAAAAFAKELLLYVSVEETVRETPLKDIVDVLKQHATDAGRFYQQQEEFNLQQKSYVQNEELQQCYQFFETSIYSEFKNQIDDALPGTCQWLLQDSLYQQWLYSSHNDILWISAGPGYGKSVLSKYLIDVCFKKGSTAAETAELSAGTRCPTICYFFFKDNEQQGGVAQALCAILHQLFTQQPPLVDYALSAWRKSKGKLKENVEQMWNILLAASNAPEAESVFCVLDALDEIDDSPYRRKLLFDFLNQFHSQKKSSATDRNHLKIVVTSRPYSEIQARLGSLPTVRGENHVDEIHEDIDNFVNFKVNELAREQDLSVHTKNRIKSSLLATQNQSYLWLVLVIEHLNNAFFNSVVTGQVSLQSLPKTVEDAYERLLEKVTSAETKKLAKSVLTIVVGARRPLTVDETALALGIGLLRVSALKDLSIDGPNLRKKIPLWCGLFVSIRNDKVYLLHQTAKQFLLQRQNEPTPTQNEWKYSFSHTEVERTMVSICVIFLTFPEFQEERGHELLKGDGRATPGLKEFFTYSAQHWAQHLYEAKTIFDDATRFAVNLLYDSSSKLYDCWTSVMWHSDRYCHLKFDMDKIMLSAFNGHSDWLQQFLNISQYDLHSKDANRRTALMWAAVRGNVSAVRILMGAGAPVEYENSEDGDALQTASLEGHLDVVDTLIMLGADVNSDCGQYGGALQAASEAGHAEVIELLLDHGARIDFRTGYYGTPLQIASSYGHETAVQVLLDRGSDIHLESGSYGTALQVASFGGHLHVIELLLHHGADVNQVGGEHCTALQAAAAEGHVRAIEILLAWGAEINIEGGSYGSALHAASSEGHLKAVEVLLMYGADIDAGKNEDFTALDAALEDGQTEVVRILRRWSARSVTNNSSENDHSYTSISVAPFEDQPQKLQVIRTRDETTCSHVNEQETSVPIQHEGFEYTFELQWEWSTYVEQEFSPTEDINSISVLWQDSERIRLTSVAEFIDRSETAAFTALMRLLKQLSRTSARAGYEAVEVTEADQWMKLEGSWIAAGPKEGSNPGLQIMLKSNQAIGTSVMEKMLAQLAIVLRPAQEGLWWSRVDFRRSHQKTQILLEPLESAQISACWPELFSHKVIATSTPVSNRSGYHPPSTYFELDLPLSDMMTLCDADRAVDIDGGLCILGVYSLLIPVESRVCMDGIETELVWHLLTINSASRKPSQARQKLWAEFSRWTQTHQRSLHVRDEKEFREFRRHLLGWTEKSVITLGTMEQLYDLRRTNGRVLGYEAAETTFNFGLNVGYGGSGISTSRSVKLGRAELSRPHNHKNDVVDWLLESIEEQTLLYHPERRQAWLLPKIAVVHHLALERMRYVYSRQTDTSVDLPYLDCRTSDPVKTFDILKENLDRPFPHWSGKVHSLLDALRSILDVMGLMERSNILKGHRRVLRGFEAYDVVHQTPYYRIKEANTSNHLLALKSLGGWVNLLEDVSVVLFYKGIHDPIIADSADAVEGCQKCERVPWGENYLTASIYSLYELGKKYNRKDFGRGQLASQAWWWYKTAWNDDRDAFHKCIASRLQAVRTSKPIDSKPPSALLRTFRHGAVVFCPGTGISDNLKSLLKGNH